MRMNGAWHLYRSGERWWHAPSRAVVVIHTDAFVAPCFYAPVVELLTERQLARHAALAGLGPDLTADAADLDAVRARFRAHDDERIGEAIMRQSIAAGVGNAYKSEVLFLARVSPFARVRELDDETLTRVVTLARDLLRANRARARRRTPRSLDPRESLWVYERAGRACRVCASRIASSAQGLDARMTYFCASCQRVGERS
jgi:endonuclease-8